MIAIGCMPTDSLFRWDEAEADATKTLDLCPRNLKALVRRGRARKELGKWDQARAGKDLSQVLRVYADQFNQTFRCSLIMKAIRCSLLKNLRPSQKPKARRHPSHRLASKAISRISVSRMTRTLLSSPFIPQQPARVHSPPETFREGTLSCPRNRYFPCPQVDLHHSCAVPWKLQSETCLLPI